MIYGLLVLLRPLLYLGSMFRALSAWGAGLR